MAHSIHFASASYQSLDDTTPGSIESGGPHTLAAWIYADSLTAVASIFDMLGPGGYLWAFVDTGGMVRFWVNDYLHSLNGPTIGASAWHFVVIKFNGTAGTASLSVDDGTPASVTGLTTWSGALTQRTVAGKWPGYGGVNTFDGLIYLPSHWTRALSAGEITSLYNSGNARALADYAGLGLTTSLIYAATGDNGSDLGADDSGSGNGMVNLNTATQSSTTPYVNPATAGTLSLTSVSVGSVVLGVATNTGGTSPYSNQLQRSTHGAGTWANVGSPVAGATATLTDTTAAASGHYDYRDKVTDNVATIVYSNTVEVTVPSTVVPGTASVGSSYGNVAVSIVGTAGGTSPYSSQLQRSAAGAGSWANVGSPVTGASPKFNDQTATNGTAYDYRVAVSDSETSPQTVNSSTVTVTTGTASGGKFANTFGGFL